MRFPDQAARTTGGFFVLAMFALLSSCATPQTDRLLRTAEAFPLPVEIVDVPFFPQEEFQCGPAALGMVLNFGGLDLRAEHLSPQVYLPGREGSLQAEMMAATRRHGFIPYVLRPHLDAVVAELAAGHPVVVLQNLALDWYPKWHYAVAIGFDLTKGEITLRSGIEARHTVSLETFERTWARGEHWAMVAMPPGRLPQTAEDERYVRSVVALERLQRWGAVRASYAAALKRWPKNQLARLGLGHSHYQLGNLDGARAAFEQASRDHPDSAPAFNNLAHVLMELARFTEAERAARRAIELGGPHLDTSRATLAEILARRGRRSALN